MYLKNMFAFFKRKQVSKLYCTIEEVLLFGNSEHVANKTEHYSVSKPEHSLQGFSV